MNANGKENNREDDQDHVRGSREDEQAQEQAQAAALLGFPAAAAEVTRSRRREQDRLQQAAAFEQVELQRSPVIAGEEVLSAEIARLRSELDREREARAIAEKLQQGKYYAAIEQVWTSRSMDYLSVTHFNNLKRSEAPQFIPRFGTRYGTTTVGDRHHVYANTKDNALDEEYTLAADEGGSSRASEAQNKAIVWPTDIFGSTSLVGKELAHLIPANRANLYYNVAQWVLGIDDDHASWTTLQKSIHGARKNDTKNKAPLTGIKHFVPNFIRIGGQCHYLDRYPCVLIVPVMNRSEMLAWNGGEYYALIMAGMYIDPMIPLNDVCRAIGMTELGDLAENSDIETARQLLQDVVLGMAYALTERNLPSGIPDDQIPKIEKLREMFLNGSSRGMVLVPQASEFSRQEQLKVRRILFAAHDGSEEQHPAPDPLILTVHASVTWSRRLGQPLMAAAEPKDEDENDEEDSLYALALEQYLSRFENQNRPKTWEDLARGLGQPFGYQGDGTIAS